MGCRGCKYLAKESEMTEERGHRVSEQGNDKNVRMPYGASENGLGDSC